VSQRAEVNLVSAFGRGESLAIELRNQGFTARVLDFTGALPSHCSRGVGPFPVVLRPFTSAQGQWQTKVAPLNRGLTFWLPDGPLELSGPMAAFYSENRKDIQSLEKPSGTFAEDWLRRFLLQWSLAWQRDSWAVDKGSAFPSKEVLGLVPSHDEPQMASFERFRFEGYPVVTCDELVDLRLDNSQLSEVVVRSGQEMVLPAEQWIWCLSGRETEILSLDLSKKLFPRGVLRPEWSWMRLSARCEHGPWSSGFPDFTVVMGDVFLPWTYTNVVHLRRWGADGFQVWLKIPSQRAGESEARAGWAREVEDLLNRRLTLAKWTVSSEDWAICPHSPVFEQEPLMADSPKWKNWDWIAPETLPRLDLGARFEREAECFKRLKQWRSDQLKKQGVASDSPLHAP